MVNPELTRWSFKINQAFKVEIFVAGSYHEALRTCRHFCMNKGLCVNVQETYYVYTGAEEPGVKVTLVNYPRFPTPQRDLLAMARVLGQKLAEDLCQWSFLIQPSTGDAEWHTRRRDKPTTT